MIKMKENRDSFSWPNKSNSYALGITFAKSGLDLDITQNLEIWSIVSLENIL